MHFLHTRKLLLLLLNVIISCSCTMCNVHAASDALALLTITVLCILHRMRTHTTLPGNRSSISFMHYCTVQVSIILVGTYIIIIIIISVALQLHMNLELDTFKISLEQRMYKLYAVHLPIHFISYVEKHEYIIRNKWNNVVVSVDLSCVSTVRLKCGLNFRVDKRSVSRICEFIFVVGYRLMVYYCHARYWRSQNF